MPYGTLALDAIQTSGNLAITGNTIVTGNVTANTYNLVSRTLGTATPGRLEYNGTAPFFTPMGTQRGVIPGMQYYRLDSAVVGTNATGSQNVLGVGVTLTASTQYAFECYFAYTKSAGATSHNFQMGFGGTATLNNISYDATVKSSTSSFTSSAANDTQTTFIQTASATTLNAFASASIYLTHKIFGIVSVNAGGTFIPQYTLSAAPGGAYTTVTGSYMRIYPIGAAGANVSVGTWA